MVYYILVGEKQSLNKNKAIKIMTGDIKGHGI